MIMSEDSNTTKKGDTPTVENEELTFESALEKLEAHVRTLEQGELTLNESLHIFEDGMKLAKFCGKKLDEAEQKIEILLEKNGELVKEPFDVQDDDE